MGECIVITVKQRQEFRIRLQKRARRTAEKKLELFEEERHSKTKQIEALKDLCCKAGINAADIAACTPRQHGHLSATLGALSSVARLSVSMTMLMSSGGPRRGGPPEPGVKVKGGGGVVALNVLHEGGDSSRAASSLLRCRTIPTLLEGLPYVQKTSTSSNSIDGAGNKRKAFGSKGSKYGFRTNRQSTSVTDGAIEEAMSMTSSLADDYVTSSPVNNNGERLTKARCYIGSSGPQRTSPINKSGVEIIVDGIFEEGNSPEETLRSSTAATASRDPVLRTASKDPMTSTGGGVGGRCFTLLDDDNNDEIIGEEGPPDLTPFKDYRDSNSQMLLLGDII